MANMADRFTSEDFDAEKFVNEISARCVGGAELNSQKAKLQVLSDETHAALKRNVFQHYEQFIDTAKDISYLAGEMYQISQMVRDQRSLIQNILDTSVIAKKGQNSVVSPTDAEMKMKTNDDENRKKLLGVLEKVEGAGEIVADQTRSLIFEGDLLEIDPDNYSAVQRKRGYLFNDGVMLAVWVTNRRGPQRYKYQAFYELGSLGLVVNIRDPECPKHTFKLLIFPSVHLLQCPNQQDKDAWINQIESLQKILRNPQKMTKVTSIDSPTQENMPGFPSMESERARSPEESMGAMSFQNPLPDWVIDIPEDLDVWIAQRNFTEAVDLYDTFKEFLETQPLTLNLKEIKLKVEGRIKSLIEILVGDLEIMTPEKILQGGPRSIRKSVDLLVRLGRENQASQLFLAHRSAYIKHRLKRLKTEGRSQMYMGNLSEVFFSNIVETMTAYRKSFTTNVGGAAGLVVWVNTEVNNFVNNFCRQLFTPQCHLSSVAKSVAKLRSDSQNLTEFGMDVSCIVDTLLLVPIERTVKDAKDKLVEAIRHRYRSQDEVGLPMKFVDKGSLNRTLAEMHELGVSNLQNYNKVDNTLELSSNTLAFAKSWLHFCEDVMELVAPEWHTLIHSAICEIILFELPHLEHALNRARKKKDGPLTLMIERDSAFVLDYVCAAANKIYERKMGRKSAQLIRVVEESALPIKRASASSTPSKTSRASRISSPEEYV